MIPVKKSSFQIVYNFCKDVYEKLPEKNELDMLIFSNFSTHDELKNYFIQQDKAFLKLMTADYSTLLKVKNEMDKLSSVKLDFEIRIDGFSNLVNKIYYYLNNDFIQKCNENIKKLEIGTIRGVAKDVDLKKVLLYKNDTNLKYIRNKKNLTEDIKILVNRIEKIDDFIELIKINLESEFLDEFNKRFPNQINTLIQMMSSQKMFDTLVKQNNFDVNYTIILNTRFNSYAIEKYKVKFENHYNNKIDKKALVKITGVTVCPYCNRNFINVTEDANTSQLDHFFSKNSYPLLALCFYNLIPSCYGCNNKKGINEFHISPYDETVSSIDELLEFSWIPKTASFFYNSENIDIIIKDDLQEEKLKELKSIDSLNMRQELLMDKYIIDIRNLYKLHVDIVQELLWKNEIYNNFYKSGLYNEISKIGLSFSKDEIDRMITGYYTDEENYGKRPLSKMVTDISREIGLIGEK